MNWAIIVLFTLIIEAITVFNRFVLGIRAQRVYRKIMKRIGFKKIFHFHHMYWSVLLIPLSLFYPNLYLFEIGSAMILSDLIHHFIVLKLITGKTDFYFFHK